MENNEKIKINVIGSGVGGLFSAAILAKHGFDVHVLEARNEVGGYLSSWKRGDYTFESSLHELNGFYPDDLKLRTFRFLGLFDRLRLLPVLSPYTSVFKDGYQFSLPHGLEGYKEKLSKEFPDEAVQIHKILNKIKRMSLHTSGYLQETSTFQAVMNVPKKYPSLMIYSFCTLSFLMRKIKNPKLKTVLSQLYSYYSNNINELNVLYYAMPTYSYFTESYYISGTSKTLSEALKDIILENGGKISTGKKVTKIVFENKKAIGVEVNNGKERYEADLTICNTSINDAFYQLISKKDFRGFFRRRAQKITPSTSLISIYIGLNRDAKELGIQEYCYILNEVDNLCEVAWKNKFTPHEKRPLFLVSYHLDHSLAPKGKTVINLAITDTIDYWQKYKENRKAYVEEKNRIAQLLINRVEERFPGFRECIEVMEIGTPLTMKRFSNNNSGAVYGAAQESFQTNLFRYPNDFKKKNLYFAGAWVVPGGGISGSVISAIVTSRKIIERYQLKNQLDDYIYPLPVPGDNRPNRCR